ncbi:MAG: VacJ family lipoprotein [bacterium]|nr:VacJ family lipoprotein [bacterium]
MNVHSFVTPADSNIADHYVYKLTAESITQTSGVRQYLYRDFVYRVEADGSTNIISSSAYHELKNITPIAGVELPSNVVEAFRSAASASSADPSADFVIITEGERDITFHTSPTSQPSPPTRVVSMYVDQVMYDALTSNDLSGPLISDQLGVRDPLERFNRVMFAVDGAIYVYFARPLGKGYAFVVPRYAREGIERMDHNLEMPKRALSCLLQAKFGGAGIELSRFLINTTLGLAGFYDPARAWFGLQPRDEDFGQAFASWGIGPGCYLYLPLILQCGTIRDGVGAIFDSAADPRGALGFLVPGAGAGAIMIFKFNNMTLRMDEIDRLKDENFDSYTFSRDMWYILRTAKIAN